MPTQEEMYAIIALANKAKSEYGKLYDTENQYNIVMGWAKKWFKEQEKRRERARKWNKENKERHNEINKNSYKRVKERKRILNGTK